MDWFNRMAEHWVVPTRLDLEQHAHHAGLQLVQTGTFGPQFYGLADDESVDRGWVGMPLTGIQANLDYAADLMPRLQRAGTLVVGQMSMSWHYGDHEAGKGLFGNWSELWDRFLPGDPPGPTAELAQQLADDGNLRRWPIEGRPYFAYSGCMCNPHWLTMLGAMLESAIDLGVDGINVHHNFENFCACSFCGVELGHWLTEAFDADERTALFGTDDLLVAAEFGANGGRPGGAGASAGGCLSMLNLRTADPQADAELRQRHAHEVQRAVHHRRKAAFDEVFIARGRQRKPDLLLAQWYHKYDFSPGDERSLLPPELWARDEDYIWYSQGANKGASDLVNGYVADMGLPARFIHAAGDGRPFVINKYDYKRWRLSIAEGAAHHFAALAFHWSQDADEQFDLADYTGPVYRYQRFVAEQAGLMHPASTFSQIGVVYPRRSELVADHHGTDTLRRLGRLLEDAHQLFDMILDHQLTQRDLATYRLLILPDVTRLDETELASLRTFVEAGGRLLCSGTTAQLDAHGHTHAAPALPPSEGIEWLDEVPCELETFELQPGTDLPRVPDLTDDAFGQLFLQRVAGLLGDTGLQTDAPWWVRLRTWQTDDGSALVLHVVNYHQVEDSAIEVPCPTLPLRVCCPLPTGARPRNVDWRYPEGDDPRPVSHQLIEQEDGSRSIALTLPGVIVYGIAVIHLQDAAPTG